MLFKSKTAYDYDWGQITAEGYSNEKNEIILVFNFDSRTEDKINNAIEYIIGKLVWGCKNFPKNATIKLSFDFRGQGMTASGADKIIQRILQKAKYLNIKNSLIHDYLI